MKKSEKEGQRPRTNLGPYSQSGEIKSIWGTLEEESDKENGENRVSQKPREGGNNFKALGPEYSTLKKNITDFKIRSMMNLENSSKNLRVG